MDEDELGGLGSDGETGADALVDELGVYESRRSLRRAFLGGPLRRPSKLRSCWLSVMSPDR